MYAVFVLLAFQTLVPTTITTVPLASAVIIQVVADLVPGKTFVRALLLTREGAAVVEYVVCTVVAAPAKFTSASVLNRASIFADTAILTRLFHTVIHVRIAVFTGPTSVASTVEHVRG